MYCLLLLPLCVGFEFSPLFKFCDEGLAPRSKKIMLNPIQHEIYHAHES